MGPRSFNRGNPSPRQFFDAPAEASMGPRSFNRGNWGTGGVTDMQPTGLQWGRGLSTAEMR